MLHLQCVRLKTLFFVVRFSEIHFRASHVYVVPFGQGSENASFPAEKNLDFSFCLQPAASSSCDVMHIYPGVQA